MSNTCYVLIAIHSNITDSKEGSLQLRELWMRLCGLMLKDSTKSGLKDATSSDESKRTRPTWWGSLLCADGVDKDEICDRGSIYSIKFNEDHILIEGENAWGPQTDALDGLMRRYPELAYEVFAEEPGCEIYINTDESGEFFTIRYNIDYDLDEFGCEGEWFDTERQLVYYFDNILEEVYEKYPDFKSVVAPNCESLHLNPDKATFASVDSASKELKKFLEARLGTDVWISVNEYDTSL